MRLLARAGVIIGFAAVMGACGKDSPSPVDFNDPAAISANLSSVDSAFDSDVFRSFTTAAIMLDVAMSPGIQPATTVIETLRPTLARSGGQMFLPGLRQAQKLQRMIPNLSVSAAQGRIIPDSMYGRVFEWDTTLHQYTFQDSTIAGITGVRFILYANGLDGTVFEPVTAIGTLDIIDESTPSQLKLQVLVKNNAGTTTYLDYLTTLVTGGASATATVTGSLSNGLSGASNKTLSFDQTFSVNFTTARVNATFALNNPAVTVMLNESVAFNNETITVNGDFRLIQNGQTIRAVGRVILNTTTLASTVAITVYLDGHPVASLTGDPSNPGTQWVDAGGEPLSPLDLAALEDLFNAFDQFGQLVNNLFSPAGTFTGL